MNETITSPAAGLSESGNAVMSCGEAGAALSVAAEVLGALLPCWNRNHSPAAGRRPRRVMAGGLGRERRPSMAGRASIRTPLHDGCTRPACTGGTGTVPGATAAPAQPRSPRQSGAPVPVPPAQDPAGDMTGYWPLRDFLELGALPGAVPCARLHARHILREWALTSLNDQTELVTSELVTNAVRASRAARSAAAVRVWLLSDRKTVTVLVWDASPQAPARTQADDDAEYGRGLLLVEAASTNWGWYAPRGQAGKVVWALVQ
jgi:anti-sigma regulatory factor (Ser/Thr protein kinase)